MKVRLILLVGVLALPVVAQNTCYTNPQGTTICSNAGQVIHGNTNSTGNSVYRDDRGKQLEFHTDQFGNATVQPHSGEAIEWSQPVLGEKKYPSVDSSLPASPPVPKPVSPQAGSPAPTQHEPD